MSRIFGNLRTGNVEPLNGNTNSTLGNSSTMYKDIFVRDNLYMSNHSGNTGAVLKSDNSGMFDINNGLNTPLINIVPNTTGSIDWQIYSTGTNLVVQQNTIDGLTGSSYTLTNNLFYEEGNNLFYSGNLIPTKNDEFTLGASGSRWKEIFIGPGTLNIAGPSGSNSVATIGSDLDSIAYSRFGFATPFINIGPSINVDKAVGGWNISSTGGTGGIVFDLIAQENTIDGVTGPVYSLIYGKSPMNTFWVAKNGNNPPLGNGTFESPFLTINQAILAATGINGAGIWVMPGTYNESIIIPDNVTIRGQSLRTVSISLTGVTNDTNLVTMGQNSRLEDISLNLTSNSHHNLTGILFNDNTAFQAKVATVDITVDNSNAGPAGVSNVYAINFNTNATIFPQSYVQQIQRGTLVVNSIGAGYKSGISITGNNIISVRDLNVYSYDWGTGLNGSGTGYYYGVHLNDGPSARIDLKSCSMFGGSYYGKTGAFESCNLGFTGTYGNYADITQVTGTIQLTGVDLRNASANGLGFTVGFASTDLLYAFVGTPPNNSNGYMYPGNNNATSSVLVGCLTNTKKTVYAMSLTCSTSPLQNETFTLYKNGIPTNFFITLQPGTTKVQKSDISVSFLPNDIISVFYTGSNNNRSTNTTVNLSIY